MPAGLFAQPEAKYQVAVEELWCQRDSNRIYGQLFRPQGTEGALPLVIVSHGFGGSHLFGIPYAQVLAGQGFLCYTFDFCGGGNHSRSDGKTTQMSIFTERDDLEAVLSQLRSLPEVDTTRITLMGESQGGLVTALAGADCDRDIHSMVLFYPAFCIPDDARSRFPNREELPDEGEIWGVRLGRVYSENLYDFDVYAGIGRFRKPVLLLHGDKDPIVNVSYAHRAAATYADVEYHILKGAAHGFPGAYYQQALDYVLKFLKR